MARGLLCPTRTARLPRGKRSPMMKHSFALLVACATSLLAGCELYFGDGHDGDGGEWNYCGSDGYYTCEGDNCSWQGPNCPAGTGSGTTQPGGGSGFIAKPTRTAPRAATAPTVRVKRLAS